MEFIRTVLLEIFVTLAIVGITLLVLFLFGFEKTDDTQYVIITAIIVTYISCGLREK